MTRPLKDRESNQPAKNISLTITEPRLEWLRNMAAARNYSMSGAVEFLIDQARSYTIYTETATTSSAAERHDEDSGRERTFTEPRTPVKFFPVPASLKRDPKAGVAPIPKKAGK